MLHVALLTSCCAVHRRAGAEEVTSLQRADGVLLRCTALALPYRIVVPAVLGQQGTTGTARLKRRGDGASREGKWRRGWMGWGISAALTASDALQESFRGNINALAAPGGSSGRVTAWRFSAR